MTESTFLRSVRAALPRPCPTDCPSARLAAAAPVGRRRFKASYASLIALFVPAAGFGAALAAAHDRPGFDWISHGPWPWQLWTLAVCGSAATISGLLDWWYHRAIAKCSISAGERRCELIALGAGGIPLFGLMLGASVSARPLQWLLPVLVVVLFTTALICYDEFIFHRKRCQGFETALHRVLVFGNGTAWLAWAHWCFVARASAP